MIETPVAAALRSRAADSLAAVYRGRTLDSAVVRTLHPAVDRHQRAKTVTWSSDRRSNAKEFSSDRKVVKSQVAFFFHYFVLTNLGLGVWSIHTTESVI